MSSPGSLSETYSLVHHEVPEKPHKWPFSFRLITSRNVAKSVALSATTRDST